jgi:hypothetical protein
VAFVELLIDDGVALVFVICVLVVRDLDVDDAGRVDMVVGKVVVFVVVIFTLELVDTKVGETPLVDDICLDDGLPVDDIVPEADELEEVGDDVDKPPPVADGEDEESTGLELEDVEDEVNTPFSVADEGGEVDVDVIGDEVLVMVVFTLEVVLYEDGPVDAITGDFRAVVVATTVCEVEADGTEADEVPVDILVLCFEVADEIPVDTDDEAPPVDVTVDEVLTVIVVIFALGLNIDTKVVEILLVNGLRDEVADGEMVDATEPIADWEL